MSRRALRVRPDDDVFAARSVWLGPDPDDRGRGGFEWPWEARYTAWGLWICLFAGVLLVEWLSPLPVSVFPVWEFALSVLATYALMSLVDEERPLRVALPTVVADLRPHRARAAAGRTDLARVRVVP